MMNMQCIDFQRIAYSSFIIKIFIITYFINRFCKSSNETPLVSGIINHT